MSKIAVIYWSGTGNTAMMASEIAAGIGESAEVFSVDAFSGSIKDYDKIAFGCSAMGDEVLEEAEFDPFYTSIENELKGKKIALFGSYGWGDGKWMRDWEERAQRSGANVFDEGLILCGAPDTDGKAACKEFGAKFAAY